MNGQLLLVEDDPAIADLVQLHLGEAGFAVHRESDSPGAMRAIDRRAWDLVLLDLTLPGGDGWDICRHLRQRDARLPVIIVSARSSEAHRVLGLELGADDYLAKPFSMLELVARVRALLRRAQRQPPPHAALHFGSLQFDPQRREVVQGDTRTPLTLRESDLLGFLARHPARCSAAPSCWTRCGATASTATSTPSTRTSTGCARRSRPTRRSHAGSRPCGAWATASMRPVPPV